MARVFAEPATTWRGAFLRAAAWSGPQLCGALAAEQLAGRPWRGPVMFGLMFVAVPAILAAWSRSWRVGAASAMVAAAVFAAAMAIGAVLVRWA